MASKPKSTGAFELISCRRPFTRARVSRKGMYCCLPAWESKLASRASHGSIRPLAPQAQTNRQCLAQQLVSARNGRWHRRCCCGPILRHIGPTLSRRARAETNLRSRASQRQYSAVSFTNSGRERVQGTRVQRTATNVLCRQRVNRTVPRFGGCPHQRSVAVPIIVSSSLSSSGLSRGPSHQREWSLVERVAALRVRIAGSSARHPGSWAQGPG